MVGLGEVDKDLEFEIVEECIKYGKVIKCVIFEVCVDVLDVFVSFFVKILSIVVLFDLIYISYIR